MRATACGTATGTKSGAQSVSTPSAVLASEVMRHPAERAALVAGDQRLQDLGVLDVTGRLPAVGLGKLVNADVAGRPVGECPQLPPRRLTGTRGDDPVVVGVRGEPAGEISGLGRAAHRGQQAPGFL